MFLPYLLLYLHLSMADANQKSGDDYEEYEEYEEYKEYDEYAEYEEYESPELRSNLTTNEYMQLATGLNAKIIYPDPGRRPDDLFQLLMCNTTADCTQHCKLCDGSLQHLHRDTFISPEPFLCICKRQFGYGVGRCQKFVPCGMQGDASCSKCGVTHCEDDGLCKWNGAATGNCVANGLPVSSPPPEHLPSDPVQFEVEAKCIKDDGECITLQAGTGHYQECRGRCVDKGTPCIVDGGWTIWSAWECDGNIGEKRRYRECNNPAPLDGGQPCLGDHEEADLCEKTLQYNRIMELVGMNISLVSASGYKNDLAQFLSCTTTEDCSHDCKLCDFNLNELHRRLTYDLPNFQCICRNGMCKKYQRCGDQGDESCNKCGETHCEDDSLCKWNGTKCIASGMSIASIPKEAQPTDPAKLNGNPKCIHNGKCLSRSSFKQGDYYECDGKCEKIETPCNGKCHPHDTCRRGAKCLRVDSNVKGCNGVCFDSSEPCNGQCDPDYQCLKEDGKCMQFDSKLDHLPWKDCDGNCINSSSKCNGRCGVRQCEKDDGTCEWIFSNDMELLFGNCNGKCQEPLSWNSTATCGSKCGPELWWFKDTPKEVHAENENGICVYHHHPAEHHLAYTWINGTQVHNMCNVKYKGEFPSLRMYTHKCTTRK